MTSEIFLAIVFIGLIFASIAHAYLERMARKEWLGTFIQIINRVTTDKDTIIERLNVLLAAKNVYEYSQAMATLQEQQGEENPEAIAMSEAVEKINNMSMNELMEELATGSFGTDIAVHQAAKRIERAKKKR